MTRYDKLLNVLWQIRDYKSDTYLGLKFMVAMTLQENGFLNENYHYDVTIKHVDNVWYVSNIEYDVTNAHISFEYVPDFKKSENSVIFVPQTMPPTFAEKIKRKIDELKNDGELKADTDINKNKNT